MPRKLSESAGRELRWEKVDRKDDGGDALRDGDDTVATLRFRGIWDSFATAESADGCWAITHRGVLQPVRLGWYLSIQMRKDALPGG